MKERGIALFDRVFIKLLNKYQNIKQRYWNIRQSNYCVRGGDTCFFLSSCINNLSGKAGNIQLGKSCKIRGELLVYPYAGKIVMGDYCYLGEGSRIWSENEIIIGNNVLIAHNVDIHDSNDHPIDLEERRNHFRDICSVGHLSKYDLHSKKIYIDDDAWICFGASIMKGTVIGKGAIVAAHAVVTKDVPPYTVVAGNPAVVIKYIGNGGKIS